MGADPVLVDQGPCQRAAGQQFPATGMGRIESGESVPAGALALQISRTDDRSEANDQQIELSFRGRPKAQWPSDVELLLDAQAPQVQERFCIGRGVKVACLAPEDEIGGEAGARGDVLSELL